MYPYYNDYQFKIEYDPQNNKYAFAKNHIGPQEWVAISVHSYTDTDANTIYVAKTGSDGNAGTAAAPKLTLLAAINACTAAKTKVIVQDSNTYAEELNTMDNDYFEGLYADTGQTPTYTLRVLDFTPADGNAIFVAKTGSDGDAGTQAAPKLTIAGAIAAVDGTHQAVVIMDSETYSESGFEFTGNFKKLVAADGMNPVIDIDVNDSLINQTLYIAPTSYNSSGGQQDLSSGVLSTGKFIITTAMNTGAYLYIYSAIGILENSITITNNQINEISMGVMSNDNIVIAYEDTSDGNKGKFVIYNSSGAVIVASTVFESGVTAQISEVGIMSNDSFIIAYKDTGDADKGKFVIYNSSGVLQISPTIFSANSTTYIWNAVLSTDNFVIVFRDGGDGNKGKFVIYNSSGVLQVGPTIFEASGAYPFSIKRQSNNNFIIAYMDEGDASKLKFIIYDSSGVLQVAQTVYDAAGADEGTLLILNNDAFLVTYVTSDGGNPGKFKIFNSGGTEILSATQYEASHPQFLRPVINSDGQLLIAYLDSADSGYGKYVIYNISYDGIKISTASIINGIDILRLDENYIHYMIKGNAAKLTMKWCKIEKSINPFVYAYAIYSDSEVDIQNCNISDNDIGIYSAENTATVKNNLIYRNAYGYGVHINGTGATIEVTHNTIFNNYSGIRFEGNGGSEVVKNNIIFDNDIYGILAATTVTQSYSINTNTNSGVTNGTSIVSANPLFINDGTLVPASTDLKLKLRVLGYFTDSPAYQLADDTTPDRDAGAWNVVPIGSATTWTSATIEKPAEGIKVTYVPVGETIIVKKDGTIETYVDGWREVVELDFEGLLNADFTTILALLLCDSNTVRIYPDPTTYSTNLNTYTLVYKEVNGSAKNFRLSETGVQDVKLVFSRAYA